MMQICDLWEISPIALREIWKVVHTEIALKWQLKKYISIIDALRKTLYSPTLVWWPLQNAFSIIKKYEQSSRKYYWWAFWYLDNEEMDSCITIRSANIRHNWDLSVRAWAWIVADSEKEKETDETINKANWFFSILWNNTSFESFLEQLNENQKKVLWICLWHQAICKQNWMRIEKQIKTTQWVQKEINIFSKKQNVWFYNSFSPIIDNSDYSDENRNIYQYSKNSVSMQFHPESIISINWFEILKESIIKLIKN